MNLSWPRFLAIMCILPYITLGRNVWAENNFNGVWAGPFGVMTLEQNDRHVFGTYLVYFLTDHAAYVWLVLPDERIYSGRIDANNQTIANLVNDYRQKIIFGQNSEKQRLLLTRLLSHSVPLMDLPEGMQITIVPHNSLTLLPFTTLGDAQGDWGKRWSITVLPSLSLADRLPKTAMSHRGPLLAVGAPAGTRGLEASEEEVRRSAKLFPGSTILLGVNASLAKVLEALPKHKLALFSTHTRKANHSKTNAELALELASPDKLTLHDLKRGTLAGMELVVLSACETVAGSHIAGDELMNLARAFLVAGAQRVLITLWKVEDRASANIVSAFFSGISQETPPAKVLQRVVTRFQKQKNSDQTSPLPDTWGAWVLVGRHE